MFRLAVHADTKAVAAMTSGWMPSLARVVSSLMASLGLPCRPSAFIRRVTSVRALMTVSVSPAALAVAYTIRHSFSGREGAALRLPLAVRGGCRRGCRLSGPVFVREGSIERLRPTSLSPEC